MLMKFIGELRCLASKNWLDFGADAHHVKLGLHLPWLRFMLSRVLLFCLCDDSSAMKILDSRFSRDLESLEE